MKKICMIIAGSILVMSLLVCSKEASARTLRVPQNYAKIQAAIDAAYPNDVILVSQGLYRENLDIAKPLILKSETGAPQNTCITGLDVQKPAIKVHNVASNIAINDPRVVIAGFKITNGGGGVVGWGGILVTFVEDISIYNNIITANKMLAPGIYLGAGAKKFDISRNVITNNIGYFGGGIQIDTCTDSAGSLTNNVIASNYGYTYGGGVYMTTNNRNTLKISMTNNTIAFNNSGGLEGAGIYAYDLRSLLSVTLKNNIIWGNRVRNLNLYPELANVSGIFLHSTIHKYNDIEGIKSVGMPVFTNIDANPLLVSGTDFHLRYGSPCLDAGDPTDNNSNEPVPNGGLIDIGAYGDTPEAGGRYTI